MKNSEKTCVFVQKFMFRKKFFPNKKCSEKFRKVFKSILPRKEVNLKNIDYYKINETLSNKYYQIPQELFVNSKYKDNLNSDSKILYAFLLDRLSLSQKHHWVDEEYRIYLIFTREEVQDKLNLSDKTVTKAFKLLNNVGLVEEKRQGLGKPNLIYVGKIQYDETENARFQNRKNYDSGEGNSPTLESENLRGTNTNTINTNTINTKKKPAYLSYEGRNYPNEFLNGLYANAPTNSPATS